MAYFGRSRDINTFSNINNELLGQVIEQKVGYYQVILDETTPNIYGESTNKKYNGPVLLTCLLERGDTTPLTDDFGMDFDTLNIDAFESFALESQNEFKDQTTRGMFAPWVMYKSDFQAIGGHDPLFAPFPYEDSDIFQRWILAGYELIQSRDALVYHLTCRGHRWNEQIGKDDDYYKIVSERAAKNYLRKWGNWIKNNEYQYPIILPKYNIGFVIKNCST